MEQIQNIQNRIQAIINIQRTNGQSQPTKNYECDICRDAKFLVDSDTNTAKKCECYDRKVYRELLQASGLTEANYTFDTYESVNNKCKVAKEAAKKYVEEFKDIRNTKVNSIIFLGNSGSGKTHLSTAILNALMNMGIGVRYMPYVDVITELKQDNKEDAEGYQNLINSYKSAPVLMIDDLFKKSRTDADIRIMYEIINHRYLKNMPMIISSECTVLELLAIDEALGSRIVEMCKNRVVSLVGKDMNYRLK